MKKSNKKAILLFNAFLVFASVIVLLTALWAISEKASKSHEKEIGERQLALLNEYQKGEKVLMYIDTAAKFSAYQSIYDLAANGGYADKPDCGEYGIYTLWTAKDKACYPDDESLKSNLSLFLNKNLNPHLFDYKYVFIPENNYAFAFKDENEKLKIIGSALQNIYTSRPYSESTGKPKGFAWPANDTKPYVEECFGYDPERKENVDHIEIRSKELDVFAVMAGKVEKVTADTILIDSESWGLKVEYENLKAINVKEGNEVKTHDLIGKLNSRILQLAVIDKDATPGMKIGNYVNPLNYFSHPLLKNGKYGDIAYSKDSATCKALENKITYAVKPSFDLAVDYSLNDYALIKDNIKELITECSKKELSSCTNNEIKKFDSKTFSWSADCGADEEKVFSEFLSYYQKCLASETNGCSCEFIMKDGPKNKEFRIRMANDRLKMIATLEEPKMKNKLSKVIDALGPIIIKDDLSTDGQEYTDFVIKYNSDGKPSIKLESKSYSGDIKWWVFFLNTRYDFDLGDSIKLYKKEKNVIGFSQNKLGSSCTVSERQANFCVTNNEKKFLVHDKIADKVEERNIVYNFAIDFGDTTPPPQIKNLEVQDQPKAQNSLILTWNKIDEKDANDISKFNIYYTKREFNMQTGIKGHLMKDENNNDVDPKTTDANKIEEEIDDIDLSKCDLNEGGLCIYNSGKTLKKGALYFWEKSDKFIYILDNLDDGKKYNIAVTAVDFSDNEIDGISAEQELETAQVEVVDDLEPSRVEIKDSTYDPSTKKLTLSWLAVTANYDGTTPVDLKAYYVYKFTTPKTTIDPAVDKPFVSLPDLSHSFDLDDGTYYFAVIAVDKKQNMITDLNDKNSKSITIP